MSTPHVSEGYVCTRCTGVSGLHYLSCPTLRLPQDVPLFGTEEGDAS